MKHYYMYSGGERFEVNKEIWEAMTQLANEVHYRRRQGLQCSADRREMAFCEGDCNACRCYIRNEVSVEERDLRCDLQIAELSDMDAKMQGLELAAMMQQVDPEGRKIAWLYMQGYRDAEIARILGIPKSTFSDRKKRINKYLNKYSG